MVVACTKNSFSSGSLNCARKGSICERHESFHWAKSRYIRAIEMWNYLSYHVELFYICEYLNVTPQEFFNFSEEPSNGMNALTDQLQQLIPSR